MDVQCPYCNADVEINHDDGYGYEEGQKHQQQCASCDKYFIYETSISFSYEAEQAPCLNEGDHDFKPIHGYPTEYFVNKRRCSICGEEKEVSA